MAQSSRLAIAEQMIAHYNAQDVEAYVSLMAETGCEAMYRGDVLRAGRDGIREGLRKLFSEFPQNHAVIRQG